MRGINVDKTTMYSTVHTKEQYSPYISYEVMLIQVILPSSFDSTVSGMHSMTKPPTVAPCCRIQRSYWPASMVSSQTGVYSRQESDKMHKCRGSLRPQNFTQTEHIEQASSLSMGDEPG